MHENFLDLKSSNKNQSSLNLTSNTQMFSMLSDFEFNQRQQSINNLFNQIVKLRTKKFHKIKKTWPGLQVLT